MNLKAPSLLILWSITFVFLVGFVLAIIKPWYMKEDDQMLQPRTESLREIRNTKSISDQVDNIVSKAMEKTENLDNDKRAKKRNRKQKKKQQKKRKSKNSKNSVDLEGGNSLARLEKKRQKKKERMLRDQAEYRRWKKSQLEPEESSQDAIDQLWEELFRKDLDFKSVFGDIA